MNWLAFDSHWIFFFLINKLVYELCGQKESDIRFFVFFFILFLSLFLFPAVLYRVHDHLHSDRAHLVAGPDLEDFK